MRLVWRFSGGPTCEGRPNEEGHRPSDPPPTIYDHDTQTQPGTDVAQTWRATRGTDLADMSVRTISSPFATSATPIPICCLRSARCPPPPPPRHQPTDATHVHTHIESHQRRYRRPSKCDKVCGPACVHTYGRNLWYCNKCGGWVSGHAWQAPACKRLLVMFLACVSRQTGPGR